MDLGTRYKKKKSNIMKKLLIILIAFIFVACSSGEKKATDNSTQNAKLVEATVHIGGLHCGNCVASVEKGINGLEGVENVVVTLADSTAVVKYDTSKLELAAIEKTVESRGYSVKHLE